MLYLLFVKKGVVNFVFTEDFLLKRDQEQFRDIWAHFHVQDKISYQVGLDSKGESGDLFIFDESDHMLFSDPKTFDQFIASH